MTEHGRTLATRRTSSGLYVTQREDAALSRRSLLRGTIGGVAALTLGGTLAGCGGDETSSSGSTSGGKPKKGGTLRVGYLGGTDGDTLDGQNALAPTDWGRGWMLYDGLMRVDRSGQPQMWMAESVEPNADATEWTITLRDGIVTHRGKAFTADDVLYSLKRIKDNNFFSAVPLGPIDFKSSKATNKTTLLLKYEKSFSLLREALSLYFTLMVPRDFDPKNPDGTGPFVYKSFTPGQSSTFTRFGDYWNEPAYVDELVMTDIADEGAAVTALQSGQVDIINTISANSATALKGSGQKVYAALSGSLAMIVMNVEQAPFDDARVRQAFRLAVDRKGLLDQVFGGEGSVGNDIVGKLDQLYDKSIPQRERDIDGAKSLLKQAGHEGLKLDFPTSAFGPAVVTIAEAFAAQMKDVGVTLNLKQESTTQYFAKSLGKVPLAQDFWPTVPYFVVSSMALAGKNAVFNQSHWNDAEYVNLYDQAVATVDAAKQADIAHQMQKIEYDRGSCIVPIYYPAIDASSAKVKGMKPDAASVGPNGLYWAEIWLD